MAKRWDRRKPCKRPRRSKKADRRKSCSPKVRRRSSSKRTRVVTSKSGVRYKKTASGRCVRIGKAKRKTRARRRSRR